MADVNRGNRPLSPHLQVYRPQWTSISSIFVRITGIALLVSSAIIVFWLLAASASPAAFARVDGLVRSFLGDLILFLSVWALIYHALGRLRHVVWDLGKFVEIGPSELMGKAMFVLATLGALLVAVLV